MYSQTNIAGALKSGWLAGTKESMTAYVGDTITVSEKPAQKKSWFDRIISNLLKWQKNQRNQLKK